MVFLLAERAGELRRTQTLDEALYRRAAPAVLTDTILRSLDHLAIASRETVESDEAAQIKDGSNMLSVAVMQVDQSGLDHAVGRFLA